MRRLLIIPILFLTSMVGKPIKNCLLVSLVFLGMIWGSIPSVYADHKLREIERYCEVERDGNEGELDCSSRVSDRRSLERKCEVEFDGDDGEFDCRGSHYRNIERKCEVDRDGDIDC
jgi:hypothetical protein